MHPGELQHTAQRLLALIRAALSLFTNRLPSSLCTVVPLARCAALYSLHPRPPQFFPPSPDADDRALTRNQIRDFSLQSMDSVIARRAGYFWNRDRQDKKRGSTTLTCPQRNAELRNLESWRDHVTSDLQHQQRQLTKHEVDNTFSQMIQTYRPSSYCCGFVLILVAADRPKLNLHEIHASGVLETPPRPATLPSLVMTLVGLSAAV